MNSKTVFERRQNKTLLQLVASIMAIGMAGHAANGQTSNVAAATPQSGGSTNVTKLENVTVVGRLDVARNQIVPDLGATVYDISKTQISGQAMGENAPFNQVILRTPGVAQDGLGLLRENQRNRCRGHHHPLYP